VEAEKVFFLFLRPAREDFFSFFFPLSHLFPLHLPPTPPPPNQPSYFFYKNAVYTLTQFWFNVFAAAHSGQRLYDDWHQSLFNLVFTACPVIVAGLLERDGGRKTAALAAAVEGGRLYRRTQDGVPMGPRALAAWALSALWHSAVCYAVPAFALAGSSFGGGDGEASSSSSSWSSLRTLGLAGGGPHASSEGLWQTGTLGFTLVVLVVNLKLLVASRAHTCWHAAVVALSVGAYVAYLVVYSSLSPAGAILSRIAPSTAVYGVAEELARNPAAWVSLVVGTAACLLPDLALSSVASRRRLRKGEAGEQEEGRSGSAASAAAGVSVVVSGSRSKGGRSSSRNSNGRLKAGSSAEGGEEAAASSFAVAAESSPPAAAAPAAPLSQLVSSSLGRPPLHPLRSVSLQARISEQQRDAAGGNTSSNSRAVRPSSAAAGSGSSSSTSSSSPSSTPSSARHTGYAFDHPGVCV